MVRRHGVGLGVVFNANWRAVVLPNEQPARDCAGVFAGTGLGGFGGPRAAACAQGPEFSEDLMEPLSLNELHDEIVQTVLLSDTVNGHDVRMVKLRDRPGLALEPLEMPGIKMRF